MKKLFITLIIATALGNGFSASSGNQIPDLKDFKPCEAGSRNVFSDNFENNSNKWPLNRNFKIVANEGLNGTSALFYKRNDPKDYPLLSLPVKLQKGRLYKVSFSFRLSGFKKHSASNNIEFGAVEFSNNGRYCGGAYSNNKKYNLDSGKWQEASFTFRSSSKMEHAFIRLYLSRKCTGTIWWDNLSIDDIGIAESIIYDIEPSNLQLEKSGEMKFGVIAGGKPLSHNGNLALLVNANGISKLFKLENGIFSGKFNELPHGTINVKVSLLDLQGKNILGEKRFKFYRYSEKRIQGASFIDKYGRTIVDGKPFLPIGLFGNSINEKQIKQIADNGFNCYMPYTAMRMTPHGNNKLCFNAVDASMKLFAKHNIKIIFSLKDQISSMRAAIYKYENIRGLQAVTEAMVKRYKDNPALLAWYISDENPRYEIKAIQKLRETANKLDRNHFTITLTYKISDLPFFASTGDVLCVDIYPISDNNPCQQMVNLAIGVKTAAELKRSVWSVTQAFNWGCLRAKVNEPGKYKQYRWPTEIEMRSTTVAAAVHGAKGFLFYSYDCIFKLGEKYEPGVSKRIWGELNSVVKLLKEMEPFILSIKTPPELKIQKEFSGKISAKAWMNESNRIMVAVAGLQAGTNEAEIIVEGYPELKSKYGLVQNLGNGKYRFKGENISSDILYQPAK